MNMALILILLGSFQTTSYRSVPEQTDDSPYHTSTGERTSTSGVAISQDMLCRMCLKAHARCKGPRGTNALHYGDWIYIEDVGLKKINDVMNRRHRKRFDVWVEKYIDEKKFDQQFSKRKLKVWRVQEKTQVKAKRYRLSMEGR